MGPILSLWKAREVSVTRSAWSLRAWTMRGWRWPWFTAEYAERQSRYFLPSTSQTQTRSARSMTTGRG